MNTYIRHQQSVIALLMVITAVAYPNASHSTPCAYQTTGLPTGPVELSFQDGDFMAPRRACPATRLTVGGGAQLTLEPETYGLEPVIQVASGAPIDVRAQSRVSGSYALGTGLEIFASFQPVVYRLLISAYQGSHLGLGESSLGATLHLYQTDELVLAVSNRAGLPTSFGLYQNSWPISLDTAFLFLFAPLSVFHIHGQVGSVFSFPVTQARIQPEVGLLTLLGAELFLFDWFSLVSDVQTVSLYRSDLDHLSYAGALRLRVWRFSTETALVVPLAGAERNLMRAEMRVGYTFGH